MSWFCHPNTPSGLLGSRPERDGNGRGRRAGVVEMDRSIRRQLSLPLMLVFAICRPAASATSFSFERVDVDVKYGGNGKPGWVRSGDMDGDGDLDLVAGGGNALYVYQNTGGAAGWIRHGSLDGSKSIGANGGLLLDVDRDGDLDVVSAKFYSDIGWWENPCGESCALSGDTWNFHKIGGVGEPVSRGPAYFLHDILSVDFDGTGESLQIVTPGISRSCGKIAISWFEPTQDPKMPWDEYVIENKRDSGSDGVCNYAGLDVGDVDGDERLDVAFSNGWYKSPSNPRSDWSASSWNPVTNYDSISNTLLRDMDGDEKLDFVTASGHVDDVRQIRWYRNYELDPWVPTTIATLRSPECLQVLDLDGDHDLDVVTCDLDWSQWKEQVHNVYVFENSGSSEDWVLHNVSPNSFPSHLLQMADVDRDKKDDIISEATGFSVISFCRNTTALPEPSTKALFLPVVVALYSWLGREKRPAV